jgi:hypothetical protein
MSENEIKEIPAKPDQARAPIIETQISKSKDGRWILHRTIITDIKPVKYFEKVLASIPGEQRYGQAQR